MTTPILALPPANLLSGPLKKKRVLLVDASAAKRDLRAETMRKLGMEVDCAADIAEARSWWRADLYDLVLINMENKLGHRDKFCEDLHGATPSQHVAFLVGKPNYLADSPGAEVALPVGTDSDHALPAEPVAALPPSTYPGLPQRWGILEASRRISAVRSQSAARLRATPPTLAPPRDLEARYLKHITAESRILPELQKEEMQ
jgi:hypothetical protein